MHGKFVCVLLVRNQGLHVAKITAVVNLCGFFDLTKSVNLKITEVMRSIL